MANDKAPKTVPDAADYFVRTDIRFDDSPEVGVHDRWTNVMILCPFVRGKPIYANFHNDIQKVYESGTCDEVFGATELMCLRWRFYRTLQGWGIGMQHVTEYEANAAYLWMRRLTDKLDQMWANKKRSKKEKPLPLSHGWLN